jgi:phage baseplate assembly protein W
MSSPGQHLAFPFRIGTDGRSVTANTLDDQVLQELQQLILTNLGERLFLPQFGGGLTRLLFEGADSNTASIAQATLTQEIQTWLAGRVDLKNVSVSASGSELSVTIAYQVAGSTSTVQAVFQRSSP